MINANYGSTVFKNSTHIFETVSLDMRADDKGFNVIVLVRRAEIQCFDYDDNDKLLLDSSEWEYLEWDNYGPLSRQSITRKINNHTAALVNKYSVDDEPENGWICPDVRDQLGIPFGTDLRFENLANHKTFESFDKTLEASFGTERKTRILDWFGHFFDLPKKAVAPQRPTEKAQPSIMYSEWGMFA